ncbi:MAG: MIP/aquaporin family protein [Flavobacteriales bacterium]
MKLKEYLGESIGTFILVLFGCASVALAVLFGALNSLLEVALVWGFGVALAIFTVRNSCPAHLNPAVSIAMCFAKKLEFKKLAGYILSQLFGAILAGLVLYAIFGSAIDHFEATNHILRGSPESQQTAMIFGEFYPNPGFKDQLSISTLGACLLEGFGTFLLVFMIFRLTEKEKDINNSTPLLIGLSVTIIICLVAPFTQAGLNPARDFGPRLVAYFMGWGSAAFPTANFGFFTVYILSPILGGILAGFCHRLLSNQAHLPQSELKHEAKNN